jgi:hypothetical protein
LSQFKSLLEPELYIKCVSVVNHRTALAKLRCSVHSLAIETGRHANIIPELRMCIYCNRIGENLIEDEYHFVFICPLYSPLRRALIPNYFTAIPTSERFINLFMSNDSEVIVSPKRVLGDTLVLPPLCPPPPPPPPPQRFHVLALQAVFLISFFPNFIHACVLVISRQGSNFGAHA